MDSLPDEVLLNIFSNLSLIDLICGARLVSWRWHNISKDASLWKDVDFSEFQFSEAKKDLSKAHQGMRNLLLSIQSSLESLTFGSVCHDGGIFELFGSSYKHVYKSQFPSLKCLDYSYSSASPRNLRVAVTTHPQIEELYLCHTRISFSEAMLEAIHLPHLKVLVFMDSSVSVNHDMPLAKFQAMRVPKVCNKLEVVELLTIQADLDDEVVQEFTRHCPNLKSLSLTCSPNLSSDAFTFINTSSSCITRLELKDRRGGEPYLNFVLPWFPHLTHLTVNGHYLHLEDCISIANCCPDLQELIFKIDSSDSNTPQGLFDHFLNIQRSLCGLELITIADKCKKLRKVHAPKSDIDDESVVFLTQQCPFLEDVNFSECHRLSEISLLALSKNSLNLKKLHFQENHVDHEHLMNVLLKCRKLQEVLCNRKQTMKLAQNPPVHVLPSTSSDSIKDTDDIPYIDMITSGEDNEFGQYDTFMSSDGEPTTNKALTDSSSLPQTDFCDSSSWECDLPPKILHIHCPIKRLSLSQSLVEEKFLFAMIVECPLLTLLDLNGADALTDDLVIAIAKNCPNLDVLNLSLNLDQCNDLKFGDGGLKAMIKYLTKLTYLSILNNHNITSQAVKMMFQALETTLSNLKTVSLSVGMGYACSPSVIELYGMKYLTESSKRKLKFSTPNRKSSSLIHLDFKRNK